MSHHDPDTLTRVLKELNDVAEEAARLDRALDEAREAEFKPYFPERRREQRRQGERRSVDRRTE